MKNGWRISLLVVACVVIGAAPVSADAAKKLPRVKNVHVVKKTKKTVVVKWKKVKRARSYHVQLKQKIDGKWTQIRIKTKVKRNRRKLKKLDPNTRYRIRVRAIRSSNRGKWSKRRSVKTKKDLSNNDDSNSDGSCESNQTPVFTSHVTDMSKVRAVYPPPQVTNELKTHSYLHTYDDEGTPYRVPVYAPVASTYQSGAFYQEGNEGGEYLLFFQASCEITYLFDHITEPVAKIVNDLPDEPADTSQTTPATQTIAFEAGELIGYTTGTVFGIWDFGVYNSARENVFADDDDYNWSDRNVHAVCPYDFFTDSKRSTYYDLFAYNDDRSYPGTQDFCVLE